MKKIYRIFFQNLTKFRSRNANQWNRVSVLLALKQIIDLHKGFIKARSQVNKGTTFIIRLPK